MKTTIELAQAADFHVSGDRIFSPYVGGQALNELLNTLVALVRAEYEAPLNQAKEAFQKVEMVYAVRDVHPMAVKQVEDALAAISKALADAFAASGKPIDHIANSDKMVGCAYCDNSLFAGTKCNNCGRVTLAEPVKQEPETRWDWILGRPRMCHHKMTEKEVAFVDGWNALRDRLIKGKPTEWVKRALEAEEINTRLSFELDQLLSPTHMGEPVIPAAPVQPVKQEPFGYYVVDDPKVFAMPGAGFHVGKEPPLDCLHVTPLYAAPVERQWVDLTDEDRNEIETKLCPHIDSHDFDLIGNAYVAAFKAKQSGGGL